MIDRDLLCSGISTKDKLGRASSARPATCKSARWTYPGSLTSWQTWAARSSSHRRRGQHQDRRRTRSCSSILYDCVMECGKQVCLQSGQGFLGLPLSECNVGCNITVDVYQNF